MISKCLAPAPMEPFQHHMADMTRYHWWVLSIAILAWMFDCMAQRLFVLSRAPAVKELLNWDAYQDRILASVESSAAAEVEARIAAGEADRADRERLIKAQVRLVWRPPSIAARPSSAIT
jgi:hypothetical protein